MNILSRLDNFPSWLDLSDPQQFQIISAAIAAVGVASASYIIYQSCFNHRVAQWRLPGPSQSFITGDLMDFRCHRYQLHLMLDEYVKKYGRSFGFYHQGHPVLVTTDEKLIHTILWKQHHSFENRKFFMEMPWPCHQMITMAKGPKVAVLRKLLKSLVDVSSMKNMMVHFENAFTTVENLLVESASKGTEVDFASLANGYIMEILVKLTFSLDYPNQSENNNLLVSLSQNFTPSSSVNEMAGIPFLRRFIKYMPWAYKNKLSTFISVALDLVSERRKEKRTTPQDILDVLLSAQSENNAILDEDLLAQGIVLLTAVHTATATTAAIAAYYIAKNKQVQRRLQEEIDQFANDDGFPKWEHIHGKLEYLDRVVNEVLRLHPSGFMVMRECSKPVKIGNMSFNKGDGVLIPTYSIHRDPDIYEDPNTFNPDRPNMRKPSPTQYLPFGDGYRVCLGKQMALAEIKTYIARLLRRFNLSLVDENEPLNTKTHVTVQAMMLVEDPIRIRVEERTKTSTAG